MSAPTATDILRVARELATTDEQRGLVERLTIALEARGAEEPWPPGLLALLRKAAAAVAELHAHGIGCPDCPPDDSHSRECPFVVAIDREIARAEGRS